MRDAFAGPLEYDAHTLNEVYTICTCINERNRVSKLSTCMMASARLGHTSGEDLQPQANQVRVWDEDVYHVGFDCGRTRYLLDM